MSWSTDGWCHSDYPGDGVLCTLETSNVFRLYADPNRVGIVELRSVHRRLNQIICEFSISRSVS